ncbi:MAG: hypothetical protein JW735_04390 [Prolixibacteraceae bacterium]|jgi:hypothetical protein|nr:hypothetical protein [Prolixibacteraceae bacterium]
MQNENPICFTKCHQCIFYYTDSCVALKGDNFFSIVKENQLSLLVKNRGRFNLSEQKLKQLNILYPEKQLVPASE